MSESTALFQEADFHERAAESLRLKSSGRQGDAQRIESQKADIIQRHNANIDSYTKQIDTLQAKIDTERDMLDRDVSAFDDKIQQAETEAAQHDAELQAENQRANDLRKAAAALKIHEIDEQNNA